MNDLQKRARLILIDDDPVYRTIMLHCASMQGVDCDAFESLDILGSAGLLAGYDAALVDYDLGDDCGLTVAEALTRLGDVPMILLSTRMREPQGKAWPSSIKMFINKSRGYSYALDQAKRFAEKRRS
jgi:CheY-like chemotaxis protein